MFSHFHGEKTVGAKTLLLNSTTFVRACKPEIVNLQYCKIYYVSVSLHITFCWRLKCFRNLVCLVNVLIWWFVKIDIKWTATYLMSPEQNSSVGRTKHTGPGSIHLGISSLYTFHIWDKICCPIYMISLQSKLMKNLFISFEVPWI